MIEKIKQLVLELGPALKQREWKCAAAESCTGGGLSYWITAVPGSSNWFERGFITYSNTAKIECLGVSPLTLNQFGSVSEQTAREMAQGALEQSQAQVSVAITGIAGPDGGTREKPVGTVWIAHASIDSETVAICHHFSGDRQQIRLESIYAALNKLMQILRKY
jgi:nicotinamide-nucleotide amidase